ncbi:pyrimidine/purine nucleoside phosphorylase [Plebeiibacterium sediminum]|uniref:Pyrimidine/purine nucleoside phosphorylase n=1 Tax=Plebeiibacterium sediminum TaxID=2992112 RepID=A0AAE3M7F7_9BACT|nr:pyrimidine/purine nucleoside phosphorylase [Plebeiobacterium sediminum]MCW3788681.1 pyrimidine/purine nucleoside phosphorylase [Plebeiobacterium sediminum]
MLQVNEYFEGKVKSIAVDNSNGKATAGVIAPGEFEFGTSTIEYMTVTYGEMDVLLPESTEWKLYKQGETFKVEKDASFKVKVAEPVSYVCRYE